MRAGQPTAFGEELRRLRESAGLTLDDIMAETKVSRRILEALEEGKFERLPERVFSRNFVRQYGALIGVDEAEVVEAFDAAWERHLLTSGSHPMLLVEEPPPSSPFRFRFWIPIGLAVLILLAVLVVIVRGPRPVESILSDPRGTRTSEPSRSREAPEFTPSAVAVTPEAPTDSSSTVDDRVRFLVRVAAKHECWIHYRDRDGRTDQRLLRGADEVSLDLSGPVLLTIGNAAAVTLLVNNTEYTELGRPGQVVHMEVTSSDVQILGARLPLG